MYPEFWHISYFYCFAILRLSFITLSVCLDFFTYIPIPSLKDSLTLVSNECVKFLLLISRL